jgi:hypothetical protein
MSINAVTYLTGNTTFETGMVKRGTMGFNVKPTLSGSFNWWNKVDALSTQYLIYTDSYTTERTTQANAIPTCWSTPDLNDTSFVNLVNTIPERIGQLPFTAFAPAYNWLTGTNKYVVMKNEYENIVTDSLVLNLDAGWYNSYPATGTAWTDLTSEGNNGTLVNGPSFSTDGQGSIFFDGTDDYVVVSSTADLAPGTGNFTYSSWVKPNSYGFYAGFFVVAVAGGLWIGKNGSNMVLRAYGIDDYLQYSTLPALNEWTNVVITRSGTLVSLYYNSVLVATATTNYNFQQANAYIGNDGSVPSANVNGKIANTLFYNGKALTALEILQNYNTQKFRFGLTGSTIPTSGLVLDLDASNPISYPGTGTSWYDISGVNNNGTLVNSPTYSTANGGVIVFDGTDDYVDIPIDSSLSTNTVTMCVFVYPQNTRPEEIISTANQGSGFRFMTRVYGNNTGTLWGFRPTPFGSEYVGTTALSNNQWYFLAVTYSTSQLKLYLNANLEATSNSPTGIVYGGDIRLGDGIGGAQQHLQGYIGDYIHYDRVLDATEITNIYNALKGKYGL